MKKLLLVLTVVAMASFLFVGCLSIWFPNNAPIFTSTPGETATVGVEYSYTPAATDEDGDTVTFSVVGPDGMAISDGVITWTPTDVGTEDVVVTATDGTDSTTQSFTITVSEAPVVNTAPVITAIADQTTILGETFTYNVVATDAELDTLTYSLTTFPLVMEISAAGVITWTPEFATQLGPHLVVVEVSDGELVDTEDFVLTVVEPEPPEPLVIDIIVPDAYEDEGLFVSGMAGNDCYAVTVTFSDNSITEGQDVWIRWDNPDVDNGSGAWIPLTGNADDTVFSGEICFAGAAAAEVDCDLICIEVKVGTICCDPIIYSETITVDIELPCASFTITFEECDECFVPPGANMAWTTTCEDECDEPKDCCDDYCSGVGDWSFILDFDVCEGPCDTETGNGCPITGAFECGCLSYEYTDETVLPNVVYTGIHEVEVSIKDNVGNEFKDTWTITFDTDNIISIASDEGATASGPVYNAITEEWTVTVDYDCGWVDCVDCMPPG